MAWFVSRRNCPSFLTANTVAGPLDNSHRSGRAAGDHQDPPTTLLLPRRTAHPTRRAASLCICPSVGPGKPSSVAPWHGCERFHSQPDGTAGVNADGGLTHSPDYPTASQTRARLVPERLWPHATLTTSPSTATAGRQHPLCAATAPFTQPNLLGSSPHVSFPCLLPLVCPTWLHPFGGFGVSGKAKPCSRSTRFW